MPAGELSFPFLRTLSLLCLLVGACRNERSTREAELFMGWDGSELQFLRVLPKPDLGMLKSEGFPELQTLPFRFMATDSNSAVPRLKLIEFGGDIEAYAAFQSFVDANELEEGFARRADFAFFRKDRWLGLVSPPLDSGLPWLSSHLKIPGKTAWGEIPEVFASMLHQGRIRASERVITKWFLGLPISSPVFSVEIDCWGDSALIFASPELRSDFGKSAAASGFKIEKDGDNWILSRDSGGYGPIRVDFSSAGMVGVEGCFDSSLTNRWLKNQKIAIKILKST